MGTKSNDSETYWRTGVAMPVAERPKFEERIAALGLKTLGDLVRLFTHGDGVVEALKAPALEFAHRPENKPNKPSVRELNRLVKGMAPEQLAELMKLAEQQKKLTEQGA